MTSRTAPEFSRVVALAAIGPEPYRVEIAANETECEALARRFDLVAIRRLSAAVELRWRSRDSILLSAVFDALFTQHCVVSLDPVDGALSERFALVYGPPELEEHAAAIGDDIAFEPLDGDAIDIGEAVAQELALALPPFPRSAGADVEAAALPFPEDSPFAALAALAKRQAE